MTTPATLPTTLPATLDADLATRLARIALRHLRREYPNKLDHVMAGPDDAMTPSALHPVFYGSFDWHSCVHGYWMLARIIRRFPDMPVAGKIRSLFNEQIVPEKVGLECAYFARPSARGFERPYGWAWLLKLAGELALLPDARWAAALQPLADMIVQRFVDFLPLASYPVRVGTHFNTAFALRLAADYADICSDAPLKALLGETTLRWYGADQACTAWGEPGGDEFLSSALIEAECMRRLMPARAFPDWLDRFFPALASGEPANLLRPPTVSDRSDGKIAHLDGLSLSRAWCWRNLAAIFAADDPRQSIAINAADRHLAAGLPHVEGHYMGEHWLASFAVLALDDVATMKEQNG